MNPAKPDIIDADLGGLRAAIPGLDLSPADHLRITAVLTVLIDRGAAPTSRTEMGRILAPILARNEAQQSAIQDFYSGRKSEPEEEKPRVDDISPPRWESPDDETGAPTGLTFIRLVFGGLCAALLALAAYAYIYGLPLTTSDTEVIVTEAADFPLNVPEWVKTVAQLINWLLSGIGDLRGILIAIPLLLAGWMAMRLIDRSAVLDPEIQRTERPSMDVPLPARASAGLFASPGLNQELGRLRMHRPVASNQLDIEQTTRAAARNDGQVDDVVLETRSRAVEHLVLIDRHAASDHLGLLGDGLVERMRDADVPVSAFDLLRNPARTIRRSERLTADQRPVPTSELATSYGSDAVVVVADCPRLLDNSGRRVAHWLEPFEDRGLLVVFTPLPESSWGRAERTVLRAGIALFSLTEAGIKAYVKYRIASFDDTPVQPLVEQRDRASWPISEANHAVELADRNPDDRPAAIFALRAALGDRAFRLLGVLALFPVLLPELTVRMKTALGGASEEDVARLTALTTVREGRLPFWLRRDLVALLPADDLTTAHKVIGRFQSEFDPTTKTERSLTIAAEEEGILSFLRTFGLGARREMMNDAIFVRFLRGETDFSDLTVEVTGDLRGVITPRLRFQVVLVVALGLIGAAIFWLSAPTLISWIFGWGDSAIFRTFARTDVKLASILVCLIFYLVLHNWIRLPPLTSQRFVANFFQGASALAFKSDEFDRTTSAHRMRVRVWVAALSLVPWLVLNLNELAVFEVFGGTAFPGTVSGTYALPLYLLIVVIASKRKVALDLVALSARVSVSSLFIGSLAIAVAAVAGAIAQVGSGITASDELFSAVSFVALLLSTAAFAPREVALWHYARGFALTFVALLPFALLGAATANLVALLQDRFILLPAILSPGGVTASALFLLLPLLFRGGSIGAADWIGGVLGCVAIYLLTTEALFTLDSLRSLQLDLFMPAFALLALGGLMLRRQMRQDDFLRKGAAALLLALVLPYVATTIQLPFAFAQSAPETICTAEDPKNCPDGISPITVEPVPLADEALVEPGVLWPIFGAYVALAMLLGQLLWLRHRAVTAQDGTTWMEGPIWGVLFVPLILVLGFGFRLTEDFSFSLVVLPFFVSIAAAYRWGYWAAVGCVAGMLPLVGQTGVAADTLFGGMSLGNIALSIVMMRVVAEKGYFAKILTLDTIKPIHYLIIALAAFPIIGYTRPEIAMRYEFGASQLFFTAVAFLGFTRIPILRPAIFFAALSVAFFVAGVFVNDPPSGFYVWMVHEGHPLGAIDSILVLAISRIVRYTMIFGQVGDFVEEEGRVMDWILQIFDKWWVLASVTLILTLELRIGVLFQPPNLLLGSTSVSAVFFVVLILGAFLATYQLSVDKDHWARAGLQLSLPNLRNNNIRLLIGLLFVPLLVNIVATLVFLPSGLNVEFFGGALQFTALSRGNLSIPLATLLFMILAFEIGRRSVGLRLVAIGSPSIWMRNVVEFAEAMRDEEKQTSDAAEGPETDPEAQRLREIMGPWLANFDPKINDNLVSIDGAYLFKGHA